MSAAARIEIARAPAPLAVPDEVKNRRILVVDDNSAIHDDLRKILCTPPVNPTLAGLEADLFGEPARSAPRVVFELSSAYQGEMAVELVRQSLRREQPYAVAFVDMRMPPGCDGVGTIEQIWAIDQQIQIVICTAYSDFSWDEISERLGNRGALFVLKKPFDPIEALQLAFTLTRTWAVSRQLAPSALELRNVELVELHRTRDELSAMLVHDLRGPLSVILSSNDWLAECLAEMTVDPVALEALEDSRSAGRRMLRLLSNLLDVARAEGGGLSARRTRTELAGLLSEIVGQRLLVARARQVSLRLNVDPLLVASLDGDLVTRSLENILDNALRYVPKGGEIVVSAEAEAGGVLFSVGNSGASIPVELRVPIFDKFGRGAAVANNMNLGLGLYFCRLVAEAHGGRIWVEETATLPTMFRLSLAGGAAHMQGSIVDG
jgi:signal transduction histidine kinase